MTTSVSIERISLEEIIGAVSGVLKAFADRETELLKIPRNAKKHQKDTGVMAVHGYEGDMDKIVFSLFVPRITRNSKPVIVGILFDIEDFHRDPKTYVLGMVEKLKAGIAQAKEGADGLKIVSPKGDLVGNFR